MKNRNTIEEKLKRIGLTPGKFATLEKGWGLKFSSELPIPRNSQGHRQLTDEVLSWLKGLAHARAKGQDWIQARAELRAYEPRVTPRQPKQAARSRADAFAEVY